MAITAKELAQALHLSQASVSFALNHKPGVSERTRRRVLDKAREMGYDFSRGALSGAKETVCLLLYRRSGTLEAEEPSAEEWEDGVARACGREGYALRTRRLDEADLPGRLTQLAADPCAGYVLLATELDERRLEPFAALTAPLVLLDGGFETDRWDSVCADATGGARAAVDALLAGRRRQPGLLCSAAPTANDERLERGFDAALRRHGLSPARSDRPRLSPSREGARADMLSLLRAGEAPADCYFAVGDEIAAGAMDALLEAGLRVPEDVALVGFGDLPLCRETAPPLTSVRVPRHDLAEMAVQRLARRLSGGEQARARMEVGVTLARRDSL